MNTFVHNMHLNYDAAGLVCVAIGFAYLLYRGKLPSVASFAEFVHTLDSRGGNILVLTIMSAFMCLWTLRLQYALLWMMIGKQLNADNAIAISGLQFMTGLTGTVFGALLKTMTGADSKGRSDDTPGTTIKTSTSTVLPPTPTKEGG